MTFATPELKGKNAGTWESYVHYPPKGDPARGENVYVGCAGKLGVFNTANHAVRTVPIPGNDSPEAIAVSADGSKAYFWLEGHCSFWMAEPVRWCRRSILPTRKCRMHFGQLRSLPMTLHSTASAITQLNPEKFGRGRIAHRSTKSVVPLYPNGQSNTKGIVFSGPRLIFADGSPTSVTVEGNTIFGNNGHGLAAFRTASAFV